MTPADDRSLLHSVAAGDRAAFDALVERHQASVYRLLSAMGASSADADDALQETFVAAWRNAGSFQGAGSARAWILTIARNALRRAHRRRAGEPERFEPLEELGLQAGWGREDPELEALERRDLLGKALGTLSSADREILVLRELEGFAGEEVAEMLGLTVPAMKSRLHRARLRLVAAVQEVSHA